MGRMLALKENGFIEGTEEYKYWYADMSKLERYLWEITDGGKNITKYRSSNIIYLLMKFERHNLEFTIGKIYYKDLKDLLMYGSKILNKDFLKELLNKHCCLLEIDPMSYGYENKEIKCLVENIKEIYKYNYSDKEKSL